MRPKSPKTELKISMTKTLTNLRKSEATSVMHDYDE